MSACRCHLKGVRIAHKEFFVCRMRSYELELLPSLEQAMSACPCSLPDKEGDQEQLDVSEVKSCEDQELKLEGAELRMG